MKFITLVPGSPLEAKQKSRLLTMTRLYGEAMAGFDPMPILERLGDDIVYESQAVWEPMTGLENVSRYLTARFAFFAKAMADAVTIELGEVAMPQGADYPCLIVSAHGQREVLISLKLDGDRIKRIDLSHAIPRPEDAWATERLVARLRD
jgi:hypothetical protein